MSKRPSEIVLHTESNTLELGYEDGERFRLPAEYLRVLSPSASGSIANNIGPTT